MRPPLHEIKHNMPLHNEQISAIGECMVELARRADGAFSLAVGGDTYNTAIYLARLSAKVAYLTAVGDDPYSELIIANARREGVETGLIRQLPGRTPGLYLIETRDGERTFWYWRETSPARQLLELPSADATLNELRAARWIYLSGITLSIYGAQSRDRLAACLTAAKQAGTRVVMDSNFRRRGWHGDLAAVQDVYKRFWSLADIALPTFEDEQLLWGDGNPGDTLRRLVGLGVNEICIKNGQSPATVLWRGLASEIPCETDVRPIDTTAAGDSFNAAYLGARIAGRTPDEAARAGHKLAAVVIRHRGAIAPVAAMPDLGF